ncbi:hypothetical protein Hanom_Chr07g00634391 [Helianthus anomalus]
MELLLQKTRQISHTPLDLLSLSMNRRSVIHWRRLPVPGYLCQTHTPHFFTPTQTPSFSISNRKTTTVRWW